MMSECRGRLHADGFRDAVDRFVRFLQPSLSGCNGADKAATRLARLGRPVKKMIGGVEGWKDEGFSLSPAAAT